ncbi:hypothetical protein [Streptomyces sp. Da 82-17]|uniref:hypothetical protein n=1 Tax=Streptomyces sp. Da 82-17 TaxID=3377116 RepID=UPI0038D3D445
MNVNPTNSPRNNSRPKRQLGLATAVVSAAVIAGGITLPATAATAAPITPTSGTTLAAGTPAEADPAAPTQAQAAETNEAEPTPPPPPTDANPVQPPPPQEQEQQPPQEGEQPPPQEGEQTPPPQDAEQTQPQEGEQGTDEETDKQGVLPGEDEDAPTAQTQEFQKLTPEEIKKQVTTRISESNLSAQQKAKAQKTLDDLLKQATEAPTGDDKFASDLAQGLGEALRLSQDNTLSQQERDRFNKIARGIVEASQKAFDPKAPQEDQIIYLVALGHLNKVITGLTDPNLDAAGKAFYSKFADVLLGGVLAAEKPSTAPTNPEDKKKIQKKLQKNTEALKIYQSASSSESERAAAKATLDEQTRAVTDPKYLELVEELKRLNAPQACLDVVQTRTQQAGWPDGSLWGLTDKSCDDTVKAGAADISSDWAALFNCILNEPFSTCPSRIPD